MAESLICKAEKRVVFPPGEQFRFLLKALANLNLSWSQLASKMKINRRTLNDWKREKYFLPLSFFKKVCRFAKLKEPSNIEIRPPFWSVRKAARLGGKIAFQKYGFVGGSPEKRRQKWLEW